MSVAIKIKRGDTARAIIDTLTLESVVINLTGATVLLIWRFGGTVSRSRTATITDAAAGQVSYQLVGADVETVGLVEFEWEITFSDSKVLTVPTEGTMTMEITEDLG